MEKITFECEIITPMFMYGGDGKTLELRPSEFKGMLRFWWRALHPELSLKELKEKENDIFGSIEKRSSFRIKVCCNYVKKGKYKALPHQSDTIFIWDKKENKRKEIKNKKAFELEAYLPNSYNNFQIDFIFHKKKYVELIKNLFILSTIIGGFGRRSRRGFGSIRINRIDNSEFDYENRLSIERIEELIKSINPKFNFCFIKEEKNQNYPFIQNIEIGNIAYSSYNEILKHIGQMTHDCKCGKAGIFRNIDRFASPCYVSAIKKDSKYYPVITSLNIALPDNQKASKWQLNTITNFKNSILQKKNLCK